MPPSAIPQINTWLIENKALPAPPPRSEWGKVQTPLHQELVDMTEKDIGRELPANATAGAAAAEPTAAAAPSSAAQPAAAKSAAGSSSSRVGGGLAVAAVAVAAVALLV